MHSVYIYYSRKAPRHFQAFSAHLFSLRGAINHLHSPPPVSLCHADPLDQSALGKKKPLTNNWPIRWHFLMLIYEAVSLLACLTYLAVPI